MKKIMFNDRYVLTQRVIEGRKTVTRRIEGDGQFQLAATAAEDITCEEDSGCIVMCCQGVEIFRHKCRYKVGDVVAVAQRYEQLGIHPRSFLHIPGTDAFQTISTHPGWRNKLYVRPELMPHQIRITGVRCEPLWAIPDEECMKEGVVDVTYFKTQGRPYELFALPGHEDEETFNTPRQAFAALIDKTSGRGTWKRNPWVVVYEFELVK